jgi:hypothetical protein
LVYASHINLTDTLLTHAAEVAPCNILILEATSATPSLNLPPRESVIAAIVKWAVECIEDQRIPAFETDTIGCAQELVRTFNTWTEIPVIVHPRIAAINRIYESHGMSLRYVDASTEEATRMVEKSKCIVIVPRRFNTARYGNFRTAQISSRIPETAQAEQVFPLSDLADLDQILQFVKEARPREVLTFYGASRTLAELISKRLGIPARQLTTEIPRKKITVKPLDEKRILRAQEILIQNIQTSGFTYDKRDLVALGVKEGFRIEEIEEALSRLTKDGSLKYSPLVEGYSLDDRDKG